MLIGQTVARHISRGYTFRQARRVTEFSADLPENQIIKEMLTHVIRYFAQLGTKAGKDVAQRGKTLFELFDNVSWFGGSRSEMARQALVRIRSIPGNHRAYERLLWLCYLLMTRQGVSIESFGPARIETLVVNLADVFEDYVRELVRENVNRVLPGAVLRDGNRNEVPLFAQGGKNPVKPDIYLLRKNTRPVVMDAKYKPALRPADRYEVLAFCEALQSKLAIFLSPSEPNKPNTVFHGITPGGIEMHEVRIDLSSEDIFQEERLFIDRLQILVAPRILA